MAPFEIFRSKTYLRHLKASFREALNITRQRDIVPGPFDPSIVSADAFHDPVRDGKGWYHIAQITGLQY